MYRRWVMLGILLAAWSGCGDEEKNPVDFGAVVEFVDANLEVAVREHLEKPVEALSREELLAVTRLDASGREIVDLSGIEQLANLELLRLADNQIRDIAALAGMARLCTLDLANNQVENLGPLSELSQLRDLDLGNNAVRDLGPLFGLGGLQRVELSGNPLDDNSLNSLLEALREKGIEIVFTEGEEVDVGRQILGDFPLVYSLGMNKSDLWMMPANSSQRVLLSEEKYGVYDLFWSPDGAKIGFILAKGAFYTLRMDGTGKEKLLGATDLERKSDFISNPSWSPDGQRILFVAAKIGSSSDILTMDTAGNDVRNLTDDFTQNFVPRWSPDGRRILFYREEDSGDTEIFAMDADGGNPIKLTDHPAWDASGRWSPEGGRITFVRAEEGFASASIYAMDADGENVRRLTDDSTYDTSPVWSPDGERIAFVRQLDPQSVESDIRVMDASGGSQLALTDPLSRNTSPRWSPDGSKLFFLSDRDGNMDLYMMDADGNDLVNVTRDSVDVATFAIGPE